MSYTARVLIADDNIAILEQARNILEPFYSVMTVEDGGRAIEVIKDWKPDVVIGDIDMPKISGTDLLKHMRANPQMVRIPFLLLASRDDDAL